MLLRVVGTPGSRSGVHPSRGKATIRGATGWPSPLWAMKSGTKDWCQRQLENVIFLRNRMSFFGGQYSVDMQPWLPATCRLGARQVLTYQWHFRLDGLQADKYNYSEVAYFYLPFSYIPCSAKNYKIAPALTPREKGNLPIIRANQAVKTLLLQCNALCIAHSAEVSVRNYN